MTQAQMISFGREVTGNLDAATRREWLVTNGIGGFASGTIAGMNTRRYHGMLVAALKPPLGRTLVLARLDEQVTVSGRVYALATNEWRDGTVSPQGHRYLERFHLEGTLPVFTFALGDTLLQKRIWMAHGANTTYIAYSLERGRRPIHLSLTPIGCFRDYHSHNTGAGEPPTVRLAKDGVKVVFGADSRTYWLQVNEGTFQLEPNWYWGYYHRAEAQRGLDTSEDLFSPGRFGVELAPGATLTFIVTLDEDVETDGATAYQAERMRQDDLLGRACQEQQPDWIRQLILTADQFIVDRPMSPRGANTAPRGQTPLGDDSADHTGKSIIAGYHWFGDWGRDTMISLSGLTLATGRPEIASSILRTFARYVDQGMLPNRFPDPQDTGDSAIGETPEYNTVDATLWYFNAIFQLDRLFSEREEGCDSRSEYIDRDLISDLYPTLAEVIQWHRRGTRYKIKVDKKDGLLYAGMPGVQLTWMDAKIGEWVVTPRQGKAVEINALWYNALRTMAQFAEQLNKASDLSEWNEMADQVAASFQDRFWYAEGAYLYDVIDGPVGNDPTFRPNQLLAVSLPYSPLSPEQARGVVDASVRFLLTSYGLRSLAPDDPAYVGVYSGDPWHRDGAYHQGTVWAWLIGPFVEAHLKVYGDIDTARSYLLPFASQVGDHGLGAISEVFDGAAPHTPRGCIAQAWSVAEVLRVWLMLNGR